MAPLGAKGVGEPPCISSTPAIVAAIRDALGGSTAWANPSTVSPCAPPTSASDVHDVSDTSCTPGMSEEHRVRLGSGRVSNEREIMTWEIFGTASRDAGPDGRRQTTSPT